jgi:hypothetical protein
MNLISELVTTEFDVMLTGYQIIRAESPSLLESMVRSKMQNGWRTEGGIVVTQENGRVFFHQTLVQYRTAITV